MEKLAEVSRTADVNSLAVSPTLHFAGKRPRTVPPQ
jgi:hypothetical protein